jgi:5'-deoxynucleotidase YfbR-like HD superfamily hydrolase
MLILLNKSLIYFLRCIRLINIEKIVSLKNLPRTGWLLEGVSQTFAENVAEHTFEVMIISYLISRELTERRVSIDLGKIMIMSLFHDAEEALTT